MFPVSYLPLNFSQSSEWQLPLLFCGSTTMAYFFKSNFLMTFS